MKITVQAPASSANLGPGFDALGIAVDIWDTVTIDTARNGRGQEQGALRLVRQGSWRLKASASLALTIEFTARSAGRGLAPALACERPAWCSATPC
jgi:homoserine kinase